MWELDNQKGWVSKNWCLQLWCWRRLLRVPWTARRSNQSILKDINSKYSLKDRCWSWNSNTLTTWCRELSDWKRPWCWERLRVSGEGDNRGWNHCMASPTQWAWVWANSGRWWRTGKLGVLQSMGSKRVRHDWATERQQWLVKGFSAGHPWSHLYRCKNFSAALSWVNHPLPDLADTQQADPHRHPETRMSSSLLIEYSDVS